MRKVKWEPMEGENTRWKYNDNKHPKVLGKNQRSTYSYIFVMRYRKEEPKGQRYRVLAGCRDFSISDALDHWLHYGHHSKDTRLKTLRKLFKKYKVEKRRIPKQYRKALGY